MPYQFANAENNYHYQQATQLENEDFPLENEDDILEPIAPIPGVPGAMPPLMSTAEYENYYNDFV